MPRALLTSPWKITGFRTSFRTPKTQAANRQPHLCNGNGHLRPIYYEARNDYTNKSETILLCNRYVCAIGKLSGVDKMMFSKKVVLAAGTKTGTRVHSDVPRNENRNEGTFACSPRTKTATRVRSPQPPFYETILLSPSEISSQTIHVCNWHVHRKYLMEAPKSHKDFLPESRV